MNSVYTETEKKYPDQWKALYDIYQSDRAYEEDLGTSGFGLVPVKDEGSSIFYDTAMQGFTTRYVHTTYGMGFVVTREMYEDNQYNQVGLKNARLLSFSVKTTLNTLGAAIYNNSTSYTGGDGVALLSASHPNVAGGTQSNLSSSTLSEAALESACITIGKLTNDRGQRIALTPQKLIIPPDLQFTAERILMSPARVDTANNDLNALKAMGKIPGGVSVNNYLTGTTSWYLMTDAPEGMKCFMRRAPAFADDSDFDTENAKFKVTFRVSFGWSNWKAIYGYDV